MPKIDLPVLTPEKPSHVLVTIPKTDLLDLEHPKIIVTGKEYLPGETYKVTRDEGAWIQSRVDLFRRAQIKINRPTPDAKSIGEAAQYGSAKSGNFVSPHSPEFS